MRSIAYAFPTLPGFAGPKTYAAWPVWRDSTTSEVRFQPLPKKEAARLLAQGPPIRAADPPARPAGWRRSAATGSPCCTRCCSTSSTTATGRLDPSYAEIAAKACVSARSVARGPGAASSSPACSTGSAGVPSRDDRGRFRLEQETNAYARAAVVAVARLLRAARGAAAASDDAGARPLPCPRRSSRRPLTSPPAPRSQRLGVCWKAIRRRPGRGVGAARPGDVRADP